MNETKLLADFTIEHFNKQMDLMQKMANTLAFMQARIDKLDERNKILKAHLDNIEKANIKKVSDLYE